MILRRVVVNPQRCLRITCSPSIANPLSHTQLHCRNASSSSTGNGTTQGTAMFPRGRETHRKPQQQHPSTSARLGKAPQHLQQKQKPFWWKQKPATDTDNSGTGAAGKKRSKKRRVSATEPRRSEQSVPAKPLSSSGGGGGGEAATDINRPSSVARLSKPPSCPRPLSNTEMRRLLWTVPSSIAMVAVRYATHREMHRATTSPIATAKDLLEKKGIGTCTGKSMDTTWSPFFSSPWPPRHPPASSRYQPLTAAEEDIDSELLQLLFRQNSLGATHWTWLAYRDHLPIGHSGVEELKSSKEKGPEQRKKKQQEARDAHYRAVVQSLEQRMEREQSNRLEVERFVSARYPLMMRCDRSSAGDPGPSSVVHCCVDAYRQSNIAVHKHKPGPSAVGGTRGTGNSPASGRAAKPNPNAGQNKSPVRVQHRTFYGEDVDLFSPSGGRGGTGTSFGGTPMARPTVL